MIALRPFLLVLVLLVSAGCAAANVRAGDKLAKQGKWEDALAEYRIAHKTPTNRILKRIYKAERKLSDIWVKKGLDAMKVGEMGEAAGWWKQAAELRPTDDRKGSARVTIAEHGTLLELCGDRQMKAKKWEDAFRCWEALQVVYPDRFDLQQKIIDAHRGFAADLDRDAQALKAKQLDAAALIIAMRARTHDPLQAGGFERENAYRKSVADASLVNIASIQLDDRGNWGLGAYLVPALNRRLGEYPPYGPTRAPNAVQATFSVTIEEFGWRDDVVHGYTRKEAPDTPVTASGKQPNPEWTTQKEIVDALENELKAMEAPRPPAAPNPGGKKVPPARGAKPEEIAAKKKALEEARAKLGKIAEKVKAAEAATVWYLHWTEVTRTAEAKVRFELKDPDFPQPVVKTVTMSTSAKDRANAADKAHKVAADPLQLPPIESLVATLAADLGGPGTDTIREARERRSTQWIERGREARNKRKEDEALDCYVRALFAKGVEGGPLPGDAATVVAIRLESGSFRDIVAGP